MKSLFVSLYHAVTLCITAWVTSWRKLFEFFYLENQNLISFLFEKFLKLFKCFHFKIKYNLFCIFFLLDISSQFKPITSSFHVQVLENGTLFIEGIEKKDSGLYLCHVSNGIGSDLSKIIRVQVHSKTNHFNCFHQFQLNLFCFDL